MGKSYCRSINHPSLHKKDIKVCWGCDRCPKEHNFKLTKGDYCPDCVTKLKGMGYVWSEYNQDYVAEKIRVEMGKY